MSDWRDDLRNPDCELCPLHRSAEFVCLMGSGPAQARVAIVGEAPGAREDDQHKAFVGPAGQLLDRSLRELAGIERDDCYVTNAAKCRPPENRTPDRKEAKTCTDTYLWRELEQVKPEFVLLLGNTALRAVTGKSGITKYAGVTSTRVLESGHKIRVFPMLHPAAVLRNPAWSQNFGTDMFRFGQLVRGKSTSPKTRTVLIKDKRGLQLLRDALRSAPRIAWDIETNVIGAEPPYVRTNFQEWWGEDSRICTISFTWKAGLSAVLPLWHSQSPWRHPDLVLEYLRPGLERRDCTYIAHNGKFDARWMRAKGINIPQVFDTMIAAHLLEENRGKGLKNLSRVMLGADSYDVGEELKDAYNFDLHRLAIYNGKDSDYTFRLFEILREQLMVEPRLKTLFMRLMMPASRAMLEIEQTGVWIDPQRWQERHDQAIQNRDKILNWIRRRAPEDLSNINLNSPKQVGRLLYEHLELPVLLHTKTGAPSTAETVLLRLARRHKVPTAIIKYRKWAKYINTYIGPWWFEHRDQQGRIRSSYRLTGTTTGRLSGEGGIQQVPRDQFIRSIIGAEEGWLFVQADYSQIELRIAAMISRERRMLRQYANREDIHMIRACRMTGKIVADVTKEERKKAKAVNFGYIYGMGAKKFRTYAFDNYGISISAEEAEHDRDLFFEDYPGLRPWHERQRRLAQRYHRVVSPLGRVRHLPDILSQEKDVRAEAERQAINAPVQGMASDLMLFSLVRLHSMMEHDQARIVGSVHDSILFAIREEYVYDWVPIIKETMEDMDEVERTFGCEITVPIVADIEVGHHWGEGTPWKGEHVGATT